MSSCKNEDATVVLTGATATYNMNTSTFAKLLTKGGYYVDSANNIVIANTSENGFVAVTLICTHEQKRKIYYSTNKFVSSEHNATFDSKGNATSVASRALATYNITQVGNVLSVTL